MDRDFAERLGHDTVNILREGTYKSASGQPVDLRAVLAQSVAGTLEYPPGSPGEDRRKSRDVRTQISVENQTVLEVGRRMAATGPVAALNFASATHPGGGFLSGARAQEESIARSSGLYACLDGREMYKYHGPRLDGMYSDWLIYSPNVPVFRTDAGDLLDEPWTMSIVTCPAVNGHAVECHERYRLAEIPAVMAKRTAKALSVAAAHDVRRFILGAWGCGAFGLDPEMMAGVFHDALTGPFRGVFDEIVFAVMDWSPDQRFIGPFARAFRDGAD